MLLRDRENGLEVNHSQTSELVLDSPGERIGLYMKVISSKLKKKKIEFTRCSTVLVIILHWFDYTDQRCKDFKCFLSKKAVVAESLEAKVLCFSFATLAAYST